MCGRYELSQTPQQLIEHFRLAALPAEYLNADIRPTNTAPVVRVSAGQRLAIPARWGLIPAWSKDEAIAQHTFNARAETVAEKPAFRAAFKRRRCLVPASAFFEWQAFPGEKKKRKLRIADSGGQPLALAGLWESWTDPGSGLPLDTYTIITTSANASLTPVHDRMPVVLGPGDWEAWLDPEVNNPLLLQSMLRPCPDDWLEIRPA